MSVNVSVWSIVKSHALNPSGEHEPMQRRVNICIFICTYVYMHIYELMFIHRDLYDHIHTSHTSKIHDSCSFYGVAFCHIISFA